MRYILISKSKTYGDLYFDKISKNIFQLDCKLSRKNTNISDNSRALPPYFFMLSLYSILIIFVFISTLSKITTSFYFPFVLLSGLPYLIAYIINLRSTDKKIKKAQESVEALRLHTKGYFAIIEEQKEAETRKITYQNKIQKAQFFQSELEKLKIDFNRMSASSASPQKRGYEFEQFLNSLFNLFDLDPKCSYKISGEQIDGAFTHDNQDYLIEAKWEAKAMPKSALHAFSGKVKDKLTTTLGLFISISGFADECIRRENSNIILMDYQDIIMVIENRIDLKQLIYLKRQHASQTGIILYHPAC